MNLIINIVVYQLCWIVCILGGANGVPLAGIVVLGAVVVYHLYTADRPTAELVLLGFAALVGALWESLLVAAGWLVYPSGTLIAGTAPYWIVALWVAFATTFNVSLRWFKTHLVWASALGALGGPLAFLAGERLGGVTFNDHIAGLAALAVGWAVLMPLMMLVARRWNGFGQIGLPAPAPAVAGH